VSTSAQIELWHAEKVATLAPVTKAANGIHYAAWGETRISETDLERLVGVVPASLSAALKNRAYYFVPLAIADTGEVLIAPSYTVDLGDRAICHRNATFGETEAVFLSTRLVEDRFGLAFEFLINVAHNFVDAAGVPESFSALAWSQAEAQVRGRRTASPAGPKESQESSTSAPAAAFTSRHSLTLWRFTCFRWRWISIITICASASTRCWLPRPWPSGCATWRRCFPPTPATSSRFSTAARAES